jgi:DNA replication ATP-dependent helicase Dna2
MNEKQIINQLLDATSQERDRLEDPKNRARYFVFGKIAEKKDNNEFSVIFRNVHDRIIKDVRWANQKGDTLLYRIGDFFMPAKTDIIEHDSIKVCFSKEDIKKYDLDYSIMTSETENGIEYIMDNRELIEFLFTFLESKRDIPNTLIKYLFLEKNVCPINTNISPSFFNDLNNSQRSAIQKSLSQKLTFIWGPPGTGKTKTMAALAANLVINKKRVLLTALSNKALDQLFIKTLKLIDNRLKNISVARLGSTMEDEVKGFSRSTFSDYGFMSKKAGANWSRHVNNANLVAGNFTMIIFPHSANPGSFDYVIADEVSMANIPSILSASYFSTTAFVVGGDPKQLPPIYPDDSEEPNKYFQENIFQLAGIIDSNDKRAAFLDTQYRMHQEICSLVSDLFYSNFGGLKTGINFPEVENGFNSRILFVHSPGKVGMAGASYFQSDDQRRFNPTHSEAIAKIFVYANKKGFAPEDIGIIAPYNAQIVQIKRDLERFSNQNNINCEQTKVSTVHSFQGQERRLIIMDITDDDTQPTNLTSKSELINVALSRAQEQLVIVGNYYYLLNTNFFKQEEIRMFQKIFDYSKVVKFKVND